MTKMQEDHLTQMTTSFIGLAGKKYRQGQAEHGGNLWNKTPLELLREARAECVDNFIYLQTAIDKIESHG